MIIVLGKVSVAPQHRAQARALADEHVLRSRGEPGCVAHNWYEDRGRPDDLMFVEEWASMADLQRHFRVPASRAFVTTLGALATARPQMRIFDADQVPFP